MLPGLRAYAEAGIAFALSHDLCRASAINRLFALGLCASEGGRRGGRGGRGGLGSISHALYARLVCFKKDSDIIPIDLLFQKMLDMLIIS
jgi:hypothetical protein